MKIKRLLALAGAVLLFAMYACTLIFAFTDHSAAKGLLKASIACTILLPVLLYAYTLVYRNIKNSSNHQNQDFREASQQEQDQPSDE